jgi:hypothetical protein
MDQMILGAQGGEAIVGLAVPTRPGL